MDLYCLWTRHTIDPNGSGFAHRSWILIFWFSPFSKSPQNFSKFYRMVLLHIMWINLSDPCKKNYMLENGWIDESVISLLQKVMYLILPVRGWRRIQCQLVEWTIRIPTEFAHRDVVDIILYICHEQRRDRRYSNHKPCPVNRLTNVNFWISLGVARPKVNLDAWQRLLIR